MKLLLVLLICLSLANLGISKSQYKVTNAKKTTSNVTLQLQYFGKDEYYVKDSSPVIKKLGFVFQCLAVNEFYFKITDLQQDRFQTFKASPFAIDSHQNFSFPLTLCGVDFTYTENPFDFEIKRTNTKNIIFSTSDIDFIYSHYYIQIGTQLPSNKVFGLGQRFSTNFRKTKGKWTIFNKAGDQVIDQGTGDNSYGYYPFYLNIDQNNDGHINYVKSSHAMDVIIDSQGSKEYLTFKIVGGIVNFRFTVASSNITSLIRKFQETCIGQPALPPFWALGFHQSRWGYDSVDALNEVLDNYQENGLPLDTIWSDIDYMLDFQDFVVDEQNFPLDKMKKITDRYRYVPIVDAGIALDTPAYRDGQYWDIFMKDLRGKQLVGAVWPGDTVFVDFFHQYANLLWARFLHGLREKLNYSGIWLDMNEIQQFCDGPCKVINETAIIDYNVELPYQPGSVPLETSTVSLNITHAGKLQQFDVHPYYGFLQTFATYKYLTTFSKFPFILSRSTTFGSSLYGFHWTGDNAATWDFLRSSIVDNMNINLAGIQMVGPDICGFGNNTNVELCARWYQLASVYPFARSHNDYWSIPQEPYSLGPDLLRSAGQSLKLRYIFLKQYYSYWIISKGTTPFFSSLAFYPTATENLTDQQWYDYIISSEFFLLDRPLLVAPMTQQGLEERRVYFPDYSKINASLSKTSNWVNIYTAERFKPNSWTTHYNNIHMYVPIFAVEGSSLLLQNTSEVRSTKDLGNNYLLFSAFQFRQGSDISAKYVSQGYVLSINDFADEELLQRCIDAGCKYNFFLELTIGIKDNKKNFNIKTSYNNPSVRQPITISGLFFYFDGTYNSYLLPSPLKIYDNVNVNYDVSDNGAFRTTMDFWKQLTGREKYNRAKVNLASE